MDTNELRAKMLAEKMSNTDLDVHRAFNQGIDKCVALLPTPPAPQETAGEAVAWQWRSRVKGGGAWDVWENGRWHGDAPPFLDIEHRALYTHPTPAAAPTDAGPFDLGEFEELPKDTLLSLRIASGPMTGTEIDTVSFGEMRYPAAPTDNTALVEVTDAMIEAGLAEYSEGGCMGLGISERRDVVSAILEAALASRPAEATSREAVTGTELQLRAKLAEVEAELEVVNNLYCACRKGNDSLKERCRALQAQVTEARATWFQLGLLQGAFVAEEHNGSTAGKIARQIRALMTPTPTVSDAAQEGDGV